MTKFSGKQGKDGVFYLKEVKENKKKKERKMTKFVGEQGEDGVFYLKEVEENESKKEVLYVNNKWQKGYISL